MPIRGTGLRPDSAHGTRHTESGCPALAGAAGAPRAARARQAGAPRRRGAALTPEAPALGHGARERTRGGHAPTARCARSPSTPREAPPARRICWRCWPPGTCPRATPAASRSSERSGCPASAGRSGRPSGAIAPPHGAARRSCGRASGCRTPSRRSRRSCPIPTRTCVPRRPRRSRPARPRTRPGRSSVPCETGSWSRNASSSASPASGRRARCSPRSATDGFDHVSSWLAEALGLTGDPRAEGPLAHLAAAGDEEQRIRACRALGRLGRRSSASALDRRAGRPLPRRARPGGARPRGDARGAKRGRALPCS